MILIQRATVKGSFTIPELYPLPARTGKHRRQSAPNEGLAGKQEAQSQNPAISLNSEARGRARIRILSIDAHPLFREGIATIINEQPDMVLVSQVSTVQEAIQQYREHQPDVTLMEILLPDRGGIDALISIRSEFPAARVIILTASDGDVEVRRALKAGASGYLLKNTPPSELLQEVRKVHSGRKAIQPQLAAKLAEHIGDDTLSAREVEVLALVARGNRNRDIGAHLFICEETVKAHLKHIREKLGAKDRTEAIAIAVRRGIIRL
jgi:DNA-binding NarL/FixJ family response regulator